MGHAGVRSAAQGALGRQLKQLVAQHRDDAPRCTRSGGLSLGSKLCSEPAGLTGSRALRRNVTFDMGTSR
jgi:hypothetical protein